ncbi:Holliday junction resolvase RecU [Macrococcus hajekii]|uniref:Holliday junction resolvase RecU n=1 Tax=Macrococcus hajekii TaxID=198482 RepID=A0A4R6BMQ2_9STAP|nr:Holliday junction resolvase RecU [Macrococcus hajekii]TDM03008.1 Holliday junction resolvase RecU [Macrococcus hajekii]GGB05763.1 Holliday junction resolvase RecU [Macrococcus hajekii]
MVNYPNGKKHPSKDLVTSTDKKRKINYGGRGMIFEESIDTSNQYYRSHRIAVIHKRPTPVQIVKVDYPKRSQAVIKEAYFKTPSTTDYNGIYKGHYLDFEAKETHNKTSFPLSNIHEHQVEHMRAVEEQQGCCFFLIHFSLYNEVYYLSFKHLEFYWQRMKQGGRKSITLTEIRNDGILIPYGYKPRLDYLSALTLSHESEE